jgi:hypothetical protein
MDIERAKCVVQVADAITATAKVEVEAMKITGNKGTGFIPLPDANAPRLPGAAPATANGNGSAKKS